jgi:hypothetical protein
MPILEINTNCMWECRDCGSDLGSSTVEAMKHVCEPRPAEAVEVCGVKIMGNMVWFMDSDEAPRQVSSLERKLIEALTAARTDGMREQAALDRKLVESEYQYLRGSMDRVYLTRRNLLTLLSKLDRNMLNPNASACTIVKRDNVHPKYPQTSPAIFVTAVEDDDYYSNRRPGPMHPADELSSDGRTR